MLPMPTKQAFAFGEEDTHDEQGDLTGICIGMQMCLHTEIHNGY